MTDFLVLLIEEELEKRGISSRQAATQIGIAHTTLNRIRQGGNYDLATAKQIAKWLGIKLSTALNAGEGDEDALAAQIAVLIEKEPAMAKLFAQAMARVEKGTMKPETFRELARYAAYRLEIDLGEENGETKSHG